MRRSILVGALVLLAACHNLPAQPADNRGRDFWVTFLPNFGSNGEAEVSDLHLYLTAAQPTSVTITFTATGQQSSISLPSPHAGVDVNLNTLFGTKLELDDSGDAFLNGGVSERSFHVVADGDVTLVGADVRAKSADAFLALPQRALTGHYLVLGYTSGFSGPMAGAGSYDMPSQFAVAAGEDSTIVTVNTPAGLRLNGKNGPLVVRLNRGQVLLCQAVLSPTEATDVSGTEIFANHRIAVFAGSKRTSVPTAIGNFRDHVVEQLPPAEALTREVYVAPYAPYPGSPRAKSETRVTTLAASAAVSVYRADGTRMDTMLERSHVLVFPSDMSLSITASAPILAAQFGHSCDSATISSSLFGDPFMALALGKEQFLSDYEFYSPVHSEFTSGQHYVNIVKPAAQDIGLTLDGVPVAANFVAVPGSPFEWAQVRVGQGAHHASANAPFGLTAYGYGPSTSYGYVAGMAMPNIASAVRADRAAEGELSLNITRRSDGALEVTVGSPAASFVVLDLIDMRGAVVSRTAGHIDDAAAPWRAGIATNGLASGVYLLRAAAGGRVIVRKVVVE